MDYSSEVNKIVVNEVWYGLINDDWEYKKIKYVFDERKETNNPIKTEELISLTMEDGVVPHSMKTGSGGNKPKEDLSKYKVVHPGDIVINPMNVIVGSVGLSKYYGVLSPVYITLTLKEDSGKVEFYDYLFSTELFQKSLMGMGNGILIRESESSGKLNTIRMRIPMEKLGNHFLPIPPREEQKKIVDFLDKKTTQIEKLIKKIEQKIELLKEQRTSLINEVVTKGLNPNVEMKDSGVEWIGEIPNGWKYGKVKFFVEYKKGYPFKSENMSDEGLPIIKVTSIKKLKINNPKTYFKGELDNKITVVKEGDIIITTVGSKHEVSNSSVGQLGLVEKDQNGFLLNQNTVSIRTRFNSKVYNKFIFKYFQSKKFRNYLDIHSHGTVNQSSLNVDDILNFNIPYPPLSEQQQIVEYLDEQTQKIDKTISIEEKRIELLKEYKQSLISEVVTGKKKVVS